MDKFIDIVLTRGPDAIGIFHEALSKDYPFVFDMLTRLFTSANIELPPGRQLRGTHPPTHLITNCNDSCQSVSKLVVHIVLLS